MTPSGHSTRSNPSGETLETKRRNTEEGPATWCFEDSILLAGALYRGSRIPL